MWLEILYKIVYIGILWLSIESHCRSDASAVYINIRKRNMHRNDPIRKELLIASVNFSMEESVTTSLSSQLHSCMAQEKF